MKDALQGLERAETVFTRAVSQARRSADWAENPFDDQSFFSALGCLQLRPGWSWRLYICEISDFLESRLLAVPSDLARQPPPSDSIDEEGYESASDLFDLFPSEPPRRPRVKPSPEPSVPEALENALQAVQGDGSAASYLCASAIARWARSLPLGVVLEHSPGVPPETDDICNRRVTRPDQWQWREPRPKHWSPLVEIAGDTVNVRFFSFHTALRFHAGLQEEILGHHDRYQLGDYRGHLEDRAVALGERTGAMF